MNKLERSKLAFKKWMEKEEELKNVFQNNQPYEVVVENDYRHIVEEINLLRKESNLYTDYLNLKKR